MKDLLWHEKAALSIMEDISDRRGLENEIDQIDKEILEEMKEKWSIIIKNALDYESLPDPTKHKGECIEVKRQGPMKVVIDLIDPRTNQNAAIIQLQELVAELVLKRY